ncbi:IS5 family transposase [Streptomyces sp.]|uniref:IS5 family transposase n=1 Tax=Streptomyces sp. TaxID=1931 RepID=UPI0039C9C708
MGRGDLTDQEWERLRPFLPVSNGRCGRWRDHRQVINGILHRVRTGVQWRDLPERFGPWKTVYERHRSWSADGTWEGLLQQARAAADAAGELDWDISVDSTIMRAHQHAAGARTEGPPAGSALAQPTLPSLATARTSAATSRAAAADSIKRTAPEPSPLALARHSGPVVSNPAAANASASSPPASVASRQPAT